MSRSFARSRSLVALALPALFACSSSAEHPSSSSTQRDTTQSLPPCSELYGTTCWQPYSDAIDACQASYQGDFTALNCCTARSNHNLKICAATQLACDTGYDDSDPTVYGCNPDWSNPGTIVHSADRSFEMPLSGNPEPVEQWGSIFEGYMSFTTMFGDFKDWRVATFQDATGATYRPSDGTGVQTNYLRLPLPLTLEGYSGSFGNVLNLTSVTFEVTKTKPPPSIHAQFSAFLERDRIGQIGEDLPGVTVRFDATATFFQNFTTGNSCEQITFVEQDNSFEQTLTPASASSTLTFTAPLLIFTDPTCVSSRLTSPEDPNEDVTLDISNIVLTSSK